jgi:predicted PurR-regulated permease PerM
MLGIDRTAAKYTFTAAVVLLLLCLVYAMRVTLFIFILALLFAYLLSPLVNLLDRFLPGRTRTAALALAYIIFVAVTVLVGFEIGSRVVQQATQLVNYLPGMIAGLEKPSHNLPTNIDVMKEEVLDKVRQAVSTGAGELIASLPQAGMKALTAVSYLVYVAVIPILAFFFLKDARTMREHALDLVPGGPRRELLDDVMADVHLLLAHYMRALVVLSLATFTAYSIAFSILRVPFGVLLAALAGMLEFIPMIGPLVAVLTIVLVAGVSGINVLVILIFLAAYRLFQDYILSPHLMGRGVEVHPLLVLFGVFAGAEIAGVAGTFLSVPVLALVRILYLRIRKVRLAANPHPGRVTL